jgi:hypothetical protein
MHKVPMYVNIFQAASSLEEKCRNYPKAIAIAKLGLTHHPNYALYSALIRLEEKRALLLAHSQDALDLTEARNAIESAIRSIPKAINFYPTKWLN